MQVERSDLVARDMASLEPWQISLHSRTIKNAFWSLPDNELLAGKVASEPPLVGRDTQYIEDLSWVCVEQAKNLLMNANYSIAEIASELGFESLERFNRTFRTMVGKPPHAYRARLPTRSVSAL